MSCFYLRFDTTHVPESTGDKLKNSIHRRIIIVQSEKKIKAVDIATNSE